MKVKICGVTRREDASVAAEAGADFVGAVLSPGFARSVTPERAASYFGGGGAATLVGVFVDADPGEVVRAAQSAGAGVVQLHGDEPPELAESLRSEGPWTLWKAVRVVTLDDVDRAVERYAGVVDGFLLDGAPPGARGGGHGTSFPWTAVAGARERMGGLTLVVAGGLDPGNVGDAVRLLAPDVVDVSSGVEASKGVKDPELVAAFVRNARSAAGSLRE